VYYREDVPVAVLGMNQPKLFTKWRRNLTAPVAATSGSQGADTSALVGAAVLS
jgi:hypothetical protein